MAVASPVDPTIAVESNGSATGNLLTSKGPG